MTWVLTLLVAPLVIGVTVDRRYGRMISRAVRRFGKAGTAKVRRYHSLQNPITGEIITTLETRGAHSEDATTLNLDATTVAGALVPGIKITISGTEYEVQNTVRAASNRLDGVEISPGLAGDVADNTSVTVPDYREYTFDRMWVRELSRLDTNNQINVESGDLVLSTRSAGTEPRAGDKIVVDSKTSDIDSVDPIRVASGYVAWVVRRAA